MRSLTILFVFISFQISLAQNYTPFPDSNAIWTDYLAGVTCPQPSHICHISRFYLNGDTTIGSYAYSKIFVVNEFSGNGNEGYHGAIRNDVAARKVYFVNHHTTTDTLLYDFDLEVGDTLTSTYLYNANNFPEFSIISSIDSIYSGGIYRKKYHVYNSFLGDLVSLVEGIGSTGGLFERFFHPEGMSELVCFRQNDTLYYPEGNGNAEMCQFMPIVCSDTTYLPTITASGPLTICQGDTILLEAESGYDAYLWSTGDTTQSISVSDSGDYFMSALVDTCWFGSDTVEINVSNPLPIVGIYLCDLITQHFITYQWYVNDTIIPNATYQTYQAGLYVGGNYYVIVTDEFGCVGGSNTVELDYYCEGDGIEDNDLGAINIYPNPATTTITLEFPASANFKTAELSIQTISGQLVFQSAITNPKSAIDVSAFTKGLYLFKVRAGDEVVVKKLIIE